MGSWVPGPKVSMGLGQDHVMGLVMSWATAYRYPQVHKTRQVYASRGHRRSCKQSAMVGFELVEGIQLHFFYHTNQILEYYNIFRVGSIMTRIFMGSIFGRGVQLSPADGPVGSRFLRAWGPHAEGLVWR